MGSLSGAIQRPLVAAFAVAVASVSTELSDTLFPSSHSNTKSPTTTSKSDSLYNLTSSQFIRNIPVPEFPPRVSFPSRSFVAPSSVNSSVASSPVLRDLFQSARSVNARDQSQRADENALSTSPEVMYRWHLAESDVAGAGSECVLEKSRTVVVLLGWLGAKQKHLKRYAEWYTSRGFHAITFTFPMSEVMSFGVGGRAEEHVASLVDHLAAWLEEEDEHEKHGNTVVFHTFSNTGWLTYGAILEKFQQQDNSLMRKIRGCIVDSAPVAAPDPQVWASGFSAAFLKKHSVATKGVISSNDSGEEAWNSNEEAMELIKPAVTETALLLVLEKFFGVVLNLPTVNRRLCDVLGLLNTEQPSCPQLYIYSSADRVIPSESVESFIEKQKKSGYEVRACNFVSTPHVDHFRNDPKLYTSQLTHFLEDCVLTSCKKTPLVQPVKIINS